MMSPNRISILAASLLCAGFRSSAADDKLTTQDRVEILRSLMAEYAVVKAYLPRSKKPLPFDSSGTWDKKKWLEMGTELGPAARVGDQVQITSVSFENDRILLEINHGLKSNGHWYDHVQAGMGGGMAPVSRQDHTASTGTYIALMFNHPVPPVKADDIKKMLAPVLDFEKHTVTENYVDTLPEPVKKAIKANKAIEGMDRDQVLMALGKPRHKERNIVEGVETEDWVYGQPPGKITFVTFSGSKVSKVTEAYANIGGSTAMPNPPR